MFPLRCLQTCTSYDYRLEVCKHSIQHFSYSHIITVMNQKNSNMKKKILNQRKCVCYHQINSINKVIYSKRLDRC